MSLYARSDVMSVSVPVASGGCGATHTRPVRNGVPAKEFELTCPGCEIFLKGGGRTVLRYTPGDRDNGILPTQERVADCDPCWGSTPDAAPETPDERIFVRKRIKRAQEQLDQLNALAAAQAAGLDIPPEAMWLLSRTLDPKIVQGKVANEKEIEAPKYDLEDFSTDKLKRMCKEQGFPINGTRNQLIERLS
jgi:hypothetical protein